MSATDRPPMMDEFPPHPDRQVTLANWRTAPFNRWGIHHMRELMPTAAVRRDPDRVWALPVRLVDGLGDVTFTAGDGRTRTVHDWLRESCGDGLLVIRDGTIVHEEYRGYLEPDVRHLMFSVTKSVTGLFAGLVVDRCGLDPDARVVDVLPEVAGSGYADCSVRHVLDMTVSLDFDETYEDANLAWVAYREACGWVPDRDPSRPKDLRGFLAGVGRGAGEHGRRLLYASPNSDLLGWVLERAAGRSYASMLGEWLWAPMGAAHDADLAVDRLGAPRTAGGFAATLRDMGRFTEMVRCGGIADGHRVVPAAWIDDIWTNGDPAAWRGLSYETLLPPGGRYRSQWYLSDARGTQTMGIGIHGQWIWFDRDRGVSVVKLTSRPVPSDLTLNDVEMSCFAALAAALVS
jgi:CubicO group peptidase (beta-lactamase class C family)